MTASQPTAQIVGVNGQPITSKKAGWTNRHLYNFFQEYEKNRSSLMGMLIKQRLVEFRNKNQDAYIELEEKLLAQQEEYFEMVDVEGGGRAPRYSGVGPQTAPVMLEGKTMEAYNEELMELFSQPVRIVWPRNLVY